MDICGIFFVVFLVGWDGVGGMIVVIGVVIGRVEVGVFLIGCLGFIGMFLYLLLFLLFLMRVEGIVLVVFDLNVLFFRVFLFLVFLVG